MPRWLANLLMVLLVIGIPPLLVLSNILLFLNPAWLDYEYSRPDFPKADRFNDAERRHFAVESIEYERGNRTFEQFQGLGVYNDRELNHMVDVRVLIAQVSVFRDMDALVLVIILLVLANVANARPFAPRGLLGGALLTIFLFAAIGLFAATTFGTFFTNFHRVFFQGDSWLFLPTDSLIQYYPLRFWFDTALALVGLTVVEAVALTIIGWWWAGRPVDSRQSPVASSP